MTPTPKRLRAIYTLLLGLPPFCRWKLPPAAAIRFKTHGTAEAYGEFAIEGKRMVIYISTALHWTLPALVMTMAHEMAHLRQHLRGRLPDDPEKAHNREFYRAARSICQSLGFDSEKF